MSGTGRVLKRRVREARGLGKHVPFVVHVGHGRIALYALWPHGSCAWHSMDAQGLRFNGF